MSKRQKFVIATLVLLVGMVLCRMGLGQVLQWRFRIILFGLLAGVVSLWAIRDEDFAGIEWLSLPILPIMFAVGSLLAIPLLPTGGDLVTSFPLSGDAGQVVGMLIKIIFGCIFVVGYYASLLTANIYNVAAIRTIQLLRVAHSIGFLVTVTTALFFFIVISAFHLSSFLNFVLVFLITLPLVFQAIWSVSLEEKVSEQTRNYSFLVAAVLGQIAWALSFWPVGVSIFALFLTAIFYELVGIIQYHFGERLNPRIANEFILVAAVMFFVVVFTTRWGN